MSRGLTSDHQWNQASLPVKDDGLGIQRAVLLPPSAFLASAAGTMDLQGRIQPSSPIRPSLATGQFRSRSTAPLGFAARIQRNWDTACTEKAKKDLLAGSEDLRARLLSSQAAHSADWLYGLPVSSLGLRLDDDAVRIAVGIRLGVKLCEEHACPHGAVVNSNGTLVCLVAGMQADSSGTIS